MSSLWRRGVRTSFIPRSLSCRSLSSGSTIQNELVDLRSDTFTKPSVLMRRRMAEALVGDDVYGEDPTVNDLQKRAAQMFGKESALFVPSGTQGNLTALAAHCQRGDEIIVGSLSHIFLYEAGGASAFLGAAMHQIPNAANGKMELAEIEAAIREDDEHYPVTSLVSLENTQNRCGGAVLEKGYIDEVGDLCARRHLKLHIDGARIMNAAVAMDVPVSSLVESADSVSVCLSKGLGAPVGSIVVGDSEFISKVRRARKGFGGGMRQAGILAAAGIMALEENVERLKDDHLNARLLAEGLSKIEGLELDASAVQTNIIYCSVDANTLGMDGDQLVNELKKIGIFIGSGYSNQIRMVTHMDVNQEDIERLLHEVVQVCTSGCR